MIYYRRNLPHIHPPGAIYFITFRLAGSLPKHVIQKFREEMEEEIRKFSLKNKNNPKKLSDGTYRIQKKYFGKFDKLLDNPTTGPLWLREEKIANIVQRKLHELDYTFYNLFAYTIMPNHVQLVIQLNEEKLNEILGEYKMVVGRKQKNYPLAKVMQLLKGNTARKCNEALGRTGNFWHHESYDHFVRDEDELNRIIEYVLNNPVKAGLVSSWEDWKFSYYIYF